MQDHSHKLLFLGLTGLMSAACIYGSEAGPTLLATVEKAPSSVSAALNPTASEPVLAAKVAGQSCSEATSERSPLCRAASKIVLSTP
jgi:hypothetical protein